MVDDGRNGARETRNRLHAAQSAITNFAADDLGPCAFHTLIGTHTKLGIASYSLYLPFVCFHARNTGSSSAAIGLQLQKKAVNQYDDSAIASAEILDGEAGEDRNRLCKQGPRKASVRR